jgi:cell wall-associated NlpC family hydrolase
LEKSKTKVSSGKARRAQDWESRFDQFIEAQRGKPFVWGANDCMVFAAAAIQAVGIQHDIISGYRGKYNSAKTASKIIKTKKEGIKSWAMELLKDYPQIHIQNAKRGDVVLINYQGTVAMGVCVGGQVAALGSKGLEFISLSAIVKAWGIGHK